jgi:hypothetical protein
MTYTNEFFIQYTSVLGVYRFDRTKTGYGFKKFEEAYTAAMCFTTKEDYLAWVATWKALYREMTTDARSESPRFYRHQRWAMMHLRMQGKELSHAMKMLAQEKLPQQ